VALMAAWTLLLALAASPLVLLFAAPFFLLSGLLAAGRHPGAGLIERVARLASVKYRMSCDRISTPVFTAGSRLLHYDLIALNLAGRAPPIPCA
jgi:hypothetical protein